MNVEFDPHAEAWPWLETRLLVTLCAVVAEGNFRRAAASLGYTKSAVSQHISALERRLGTRLIERSPSGARPTPAGEVLTAHAKDVLARLRVAQTDMQRELAPTSAISTRVVTSPGPSANLAAEIAVFLDGVGKTRTTWQELGTSEAVVEALRTGRAEFGVGQLPELDHPILRAVCVLSMPLQFVWQRDLCDVDDFRLSALDRRPLTGYRACPTTRGAIQSLRLMGVEPAPLILSNDGAVITRLVSDGFFALAPAQLISSRPPYAAVSSGFPPAQLAVVTHRDRRGSSEHLEVVADLVRRRSAELAEAGLAPARVELVREAS